MDIPIEQVWEVTLDEKIKVLKVRPSVVKTQKQGIGCV